MAPTEHQHRNCIYHPVGNEIDILADLDELAAWRSGKHPSQQAKDT